MRVKVRFLARLQEITGVKEEVLDTQEGETIEDILNKLSDQLAS
jgi:molybdopterin converting factor small subunit